MGNRHGKNTEKNDLEPNGKDFERSGSKRQSGRKKKGDTDKVGSASQNDSIDGKRKAFSDGKAKPDGGGGGGGKDQPKPVLREKVGDDGELGKRPKMGRLSGSFSAGESRSTRKSESESSRQDVGIIPPKSADLKVYRSFSSLAEEKKVQMFDGEPSLANVKVYRKTPETPLNPSHRAMSLPRGFERGTRTLPVAAADLSNGRVVAGKDALDGGNWNDKRMSAPAMRSTTLPRLHGNAVTSSVANYKVSKDDLPATLEIQRRLKQFENLLVRNILTKFSRLDPASQLSAVPIAIKLGRPNQFVTLRDYIENPLGVPDDLVDRGGEFILCIAPAMFTGMAHFRRERSADRSDWPTLSRDVVTCVAAEAAAEISRMFEYQIALLTGDSSVALLADHGAERILSFILSDLQTPRLDRNTVVQGVVRGKQRGYNPQSPSVPLSPVFVSVIVGMKEFKWNLYEIFDKPGLRKDVLLVHEGVPAPGDEDRCPWKFYTSHSSDPMLYGYRGQLIEWDFVESHFRVNGYEEASYSEEMSWRFDDFHRLYPPFKRLFGARAMKRYYTDYVRTGVAKPLPLDRFLMQSVHGVAYTRDAILPVYRPLEPFTLAEVEGVDWSGADVPRVLLPKKLGGVEVRTPLSPSGELPVFAPALSDVMRPYSLGGATQLTVPRSRSSGYSLGGDVQRQSYSPGNRSPMMPSYGSAEDRSPRASPYFGNSAGTAQRYAPVPPDRSSPVGTLHQNYSADGRKQPSVSQYYSPGGTMRKIYSSPPEVEVKTQFLEVGKATMQPHYSPGGTLRRGLPANVQSHSSGDTTPRSHSPGVATLPVVQNHSSEVATVTDQRFSGYTLLEEVTTVHSIKASNV